MMSKFILIQVPFQSHTPDKQIHTTVSNFHQVSTMLFAHSPCVVPFPYLRSKNFDTFAEICVFGPVGWAMV